MYVSFTLVTHVVLILMVLPNFWNHYCFFISFQRADPALVLECYVGSITMEHPLSLTITCVLWMPSSKLEQVCTYPQTTSLFLSCTNSTLCKSKGTTLNSKKVAPTCCHFLTTGANGAQGRHTQYSRVTQYRTNVGLEHILGQDSREGVHALTFES
jgi:hypothetical protein